MQLFAIISKQDEGTTEGEIRFVETFLRQQLNADAVDEYLSLFHNFLGTDKEQKEGSDKPRKLTSVKDSVRILGICKKINKKLTQEQKVIVLVRCLELVNADRHFSKQRMAIINTAANVFNIEKEEYQGIEKFVVEEKLEAYNDNHILLIHNKDGDYGASKFIESELDQGSIIILKVSSVNLYFLRYTGNSDIYLNGLGLNNKRIYLFASGSTLKLPKGRPILYSDVVGKFMRDTSSSGLSFNCNHLEFKFPNGNIGLRDISISEEDGKLIGIMGASGAGKTTLLNALAGLETPSSGEVLINGIDVHQDNDLIEGVIGYIPQDDLLIEELTVYQNLFYCAKLIFKDLTDEEIDERVIKVLTDLGLNDRKDLKVGSPLEKTISGGQRKRLNIALELIREPAVLFVDEPTSGLSSRDSENVMDLLKELTHKGKLIFVVIHQPSSDIYKMFDKLVILDTGGYMVYYGNPVEAVMYFKKIDEQINSDIGECVSCGNVNPELIFNIIEARVVDEFGNFTENRKVSPQEWENHFKEKVKLPQIRDIQDEIPRNLKLPNRLKQFIIFGTRDLLAKINNLQYILLNLFQAPALAFILAFIIRYTADPGGEYKFRYNDNIPPYIFMSIIVSLFIGLTVSAEEIFRDRKILKREAFLNLSRASYLFSKIGILFALSAVQSLLFVLVGNSILEIPGMYFEYWLMLFTVSCFANILGLNISVTFNTAVTIYIVIPILIIPQMVLGGAMFSFEKLNKYVGGGYKVPLIADIMTARWAYEGLVVNQFVNNDFESQFYNLERLESEADYKQVYFIPELEKQFEKIKASSLSEEDSAEQIKNDALALLKNEFEKENRSNSHVQFFLMNELEPKHYSEFSDQEIEEYLENLKDYYKKAFGKINQKKQELLNKMQSSDSLKAEFINYRDAYHNEYLTDIVKNIYSKNKIVVDDDRIIQIIDPIYLKPEHAGFLNFRSHFYAPQKSFFNKYFDTYYFNCLVIWFFTILLYFTLYYESIKKTIELFGKIKIFK